MAAGSDARSARSGFRAHRDVLIFAAILLAARAILLLGALDPSQERVMEILDPGELSWSGGPGRPLYDTEELFTATAAQSFLLRVGLPLRTGRYYAHSNGSLITTLLAVPIYALLGPDYLAFKIIPLAVTLLGGLCWFLVVRLWWGRRAAWLFGLLYLAAPSMFARTALIAKGDHAEAMAIVGAALWLASRAAQAAAPSAARRWALGCGLLTGLGVFATYATLPVLAGAGIVALVLTRVRPRSEWLAFGVGLGIGLLPWIVALAASAGDSLQVYGQSVVAAGGVSEALRRLGLLFSRGFMAEYDLPGGSLARTIAGHLWSLAVLAGWMGLLLAARRRRVSALVALGATAAYVAAFCLRAPDPSSRYLMPVYPLLLAAVAGLGLRELPVRDRVRARAEPAARGWGLVVVACVGVLGISAQVAAVADSRFPALRAPLRGTDWRLFAEVSGKYLEPERIAALPPDLKPHFYVHLGKRAYALAPRERWPEIAGLAGEQVASFWEGLGISWTDDRSRGMEAGGYAATLDAPARAAFVRGLARYGETLFTPLARAVGLPGLSAYLEQFPQDCREVLRRSMARTLATMATHGHAPHGGDGQLRSLLGEEAMAFGAGWALYRSRGGHPHGWRSWTPARGAWTRRWWEPGGAVRSADYYEGAAAAYERDLEALRPQWVVQGCAAGGWLSRELTTLCAALPPESTPTFHRAAGRVAGRALHDPTVIRSARGRAPQTAEHLAGAFTGALRDAFLEGVREGVALR